MSLDIVKIKFERPLAQDREKHDLCFVAELSANAAHGAPVYGGVLKKIGDNVWKAKGNCSDIWGRPASTRNKAIQNSLADGLLGLAEVRKKMDAEEKERRRRHELATMLTAVFSNFTNITVQDENGWHVDRPSTYRVTIDGLNSEQVRLVAALLNSSDALRGK